MKLGIEEHKNGESNESVREENKKEVKEAVASREQKKKIRQRHQEAVTEAGAATPKTEKKQIHKIIRK